MKVEIWEGQVRLTPETDHEKQALEKILSKGVSSVESNDDWSSNKWPLIINLNKHPWDKIGG